jgi:outer membrane receptor protein involved in Fe transport
VANKADAIYPSLTNSSSQTKYNSSFWLENASFLKVKNISIAYRLPKQTLKFADVTLQASAQNVLVLTKYKGMDPEVYNNIESADYGAYPIPRTFTLGLKVTF